MHLAVLKYTKCYVCCTCDDGVEHHTQQQRGEGRDVAQGGRPAQALRLQPRQEHTTRVGACRVTYAMVGCDERGLQRVSEPVAGVEAG